MPYIPLEDRNFYEVRLNKLIMSLNAMEWSTGHVTYVVFKIVASWFKNKPRYQTICEIRGMLVGVLSEFDRRIASKYEDKKIQENGDVEI